MIRITIIADKVEELRQFLNKAAEKERFFIPASPVPYKDIPPITFDDVKDLQFPAGSYKPKHAKKDRNR